MAHAPNITSSIVIDDKASPVLRAFAELLDSIAAKSGVTSKAMGADFKASANAMAGAMREADRQAKELFQTLSKSNAGGLSRMTSDADKLQGKLRGVNSEVSVMHRALTSLPATIAGLKIAEKAKEAYIKGAHVGSLEAQANIIGMPADVRAHSAKVITEQQKLYPSIDLADALKMRNEAYSILKHANETPEVLPVMFQLKQAIGQAKPHAGKEEVDEIVRGALVYAEQLGATGSPATMRAALDGVVKAIQLNGDFFSTDTLLTFARQAGPSIAKMSPEYRQNILPQYIAEWGGPRTGTFVQGVTKMSSGDFGHNHAALQRWIDAGVLSQADMLVNKKGDAASIRPGTASALTFQSMGYNPQKFTDEVLAPSLSNLYDHLPTAERKRQEEAIKRFYGANPDALPEGAHGEKLDPNTLSGKQLYTLGQLQAMFPNAVVARGFGEQYLQSEKVRNGAERMKGVAGLDAADMWRNDPVASWNALSGSVANLAEVATGPLMPAAAKALSSLADGLASVGAVLKEHPALATTAGGALGLAGLGGAGIAASWMVSLGTAGPALNGSAAALTTAAGALEAAAAKMAFGGGAPGGPGLDAKSGGFWGFLSKGLVPLSGGILAAELLSNFDPKGNLWGATSGIDGFTQRNFGFSLDQKPSEAYHAIFGDAPPGAPTFRDTQATQARDEVNFWTGQQQQPVDVNVNGRADVVQSINVTVGLDGEARAALQRATSIPLSPEKLGVGMSGSQGAVTNPVAAPLGGQ